MTKWQSERVKDEIELDVEEDFAYRGLSNGATDSRRVAEGVGSVGEEKRPQIPNSTPWVDGCEARQSQIWC